MLNDSIHLSEHVIHGQFIIPISFVLVSYNKYKFSFLIVKYILFLIQFNVWKMFVDINNKQMCEVHVEFKNLRFKNNFIINRTSEY